MCMCVCVAPYSPLSEHNVAVCWPDPACSTFWKYNLPVLSLSRKFTERQDVCLWKAPNRCLSLVLHRASECHGPTHHTSVRLLPNTHCNEDHLFLHLRANPLRSKCEFVLLADVDKCFPFTRRVPEKRRSPDTVQITSQL